MLSKAYNLFIFSGFDNQVLNRWALTTSIRHWPHAVPPRWNPSACNTCTHLRAQTCIHTHTVEAGKFLHVIELFCVTKPLFFHSKGELNRNYQVDDTCEEAREMAGGAQPVIFCTAHYAMCSKAAEVENQAVNPKFWGLQYSWFGLFCSSFTGMKSPIWAFLFFF